MEETVNPNNGNGLLESPETVLNDPLTDSLKQGAHDDPNYKEDSNILQNLNTETTAAPPAQDESLGNAKSDFDEFDYPKSAGREEEELDEESDFGSFDDLSIEETTEIDAGKARNSVSLLEVDKNLENNALILKKVEQLIDDIFPKAGDKSEYHNSLLELLSDGSKDIFDEVSKSPHLTPKGWNRLNIRRNLLIYLGIPINLDELRAQSSPESLAIPKRSSKEESIDWTMLKSLDDKDVPAESKIQELLAKSSEILSKVETENLEHSSKQYLETLDLPELISRLSHFEESYSTLLDVALAWKVRLDDAKKNFDIYESVIQNFVGYSQRLGREELLANMKNLKKKHKRHSIFATTKR